MAWIIQNDELTNTDFLSTPDKPFRGDSPYTFWRVDENVNDGMPYIGLMIGVPALAPEPPVVTTNMYYGISEVKELYLGSSQITAAFFGENQVF